MVTTMMYIIINILNFEVLMAVEMTLLVFWVVMSCEFMGMYHYFGETALLHRRPALTNKQTNKQTLTITNTVYML
jgi:hypothetical protein